MRPWKSRRVIRIGAGTLIAAVVVGGGYAAYADIAGAPDEYRTAAVTYADVEQTLAMSGTVDTSGRSDLSFGTSGTVSKLSVAVGDKVTKGEVLGRLDTTDLKAAVTKAKAELASARAQLETDEDAESSSVSSTSSTSSTSSSSSSAGAGSTGSTGSAGTSKASGAGSSGTSGSGASGSAGSGSSSGTGSGSS